MVGEYELLLVGEPEHDPGAEGGAEPEGDPGG